MDDVGIDQMESFGYGGDTPHERLGSLLDTELEPVKPDTHISVIHRTFANYNLVALPVIDDENRLIGVVTVDDVLDHLLPDDWREEGH
jgi:Mg/Co/Ni transporter MgtE